MHNNNRVTLSCILPVFNEEAGIAAFLKALNQQLMTIGLCYEIIVVDDGSRDKTVDRVEAFSAGEHSVHLVTLSRNFGKEAALTAGLDASSGDAVILMDADFQHPIEVIPQFIEYWKQGYDMVYGVRQDRAEESFLKRKGAAAFYNMMCYSTGVSIPANAGDFRLMSRRVVESIKLLPERARFMKGIYAWVGFGSIGITFEVQERFSGTSQWSYRKLANLALTGITSFTTFPLRIMAWFGLLVSLISFLYAFFIISKTLVLGSILPGWPTVITAITFFGGIQLLSLGVLGEYVAGIFAEVKKRPLYIVKKRGNHSSVVVDNAQNY
ncbi:putative glycosyltransferase [invertebrate metagenome]|uniref:Putative glycosyltransferase n=1 Tax=invertebrate metagenome TaxID=1711999 RepID=A0A2H9T8C4_9ZZZZ